GRKMERYLRLARLTLAEHPGDPFALFNMGSALLEAGRPGEAVGYLRGCVAGYRSGSLILPPAYARLAECLRRLGRPGEALAACREGLGRFAGERELRFVEGFVRAERGDLAGAEGCFRALVEGPGSGEDAWGDFVRAGHNLGLVYARWGKAD